MTNRDSRTPDVEFDFGSAVLLYELKLKRRRSFSRCSFYFTPDALRRLYAAALSGGSDVFSERCSLFCVFVCIQWVSSVDNHHPTVIIFPGALRYYFVRNLSICPSRHIAFRTSFQDLPACRWLNGTFRAGLSPLDWTAQRTYRPQQLCGRMQTVPDRSDF
jgi:hypothetical protein